MIGARTRDPLMRVRCALGECPYGIVPTWEHQCDTCHLWFCNVHLHITEVPQVYRCTGCGGHYPCARIRR